MERVEEKNKARERKKEEGEKDAMNVGLQDRRRKESMCLRSVGGAWGGRGGVCGMDGWIVVGGTNGRGKDKKDVSKKGRERKEERYE